MFLAVWAFTALEERIPLPQVLQLRRVLRDIRVHFRVLHGLENYFGMVGPKWFESQPIRPQFA
jgi:hypothetical protein